VRITTSILGDRSRRRRAVRIGLGALGAVVVVAAAIVAVVVVRAADLVRAEAVIAAARLGERIGRTVTVGPAHVRFGAELSVTLDEVRIEAAPGQTGIADQALLEVSSVRVGVATWPLVRSLGKEIVVTAIEARQPLIRVVRLPGGELSYADVVARLSDAKPLPPPDASRRVRVGRVAITAGTIRLYDLSAGPERATAPLIIGHLDVTAPGVPADGPLELTIDAAVLAPEPNLHLALALAPPAEPTAARPLGRLNRAEVHLGPLDIARLVPFLPARRGFRVERATLSADATVTVDVAGPITVDGTIAAAALALAHDADGKVEAAGQPADVRARADLTVDPAGQALTVRALTVSVGEMALEARADVRGSVAAPEVRALSVRTHEVTFERLLALAPPSLLPAGVELHGPIALRADGSGDPRAAELDVAVDLGGAAVTLPALHKPAGTALAAELRGRAGAGGLDVTSLGLTLGPLRLALHGKVASETDLDLAFDSGEVPLDALLRLFPTVARAAPPGVALAGAVQASGRVRRSGATTRAEARVALRRADVKTAALTLTGGADLGASLQETPGAMSFVADLDAGAARVTVPGRVDKAAGAPLSVHLAAERSDRVITVREARLSMAGAAVQGSGRLDAAAHALSVEAPSCEIDLGALAGAVPALGVVPAALAGARLHFALALTGDPRDLPAAHARFTGLEVRAPLGRFHGQLDLDGLSPPRKIGFDVEGDALDLDALPAGEGHLGLAFDRVTVDGKLRLGKLRARGKEARDVVADVGLDAGVVALRTLHFAAFGGAFIASGSRVDLAHGAPAFAVRAHVDHVDLAALPVADGSPDSALRGRLDADVTLDGHGADWAAIAPTLAGTVGLDLSGAHVHTKHTVRATILNPILGKLAAKAMAKTPVRVIDMGIERASARLRVGGGEITTTAPLRLVTDEGTLSLDGKVGFDRSLALAGAIVIPPAVIDKATSGKMVPFGDVTVKLRLTGMAGDPKIELLELGNTLKALTGSRLHGLALKIEDALRP
jgi:uncharacterized protein involved in outer membrane biogenesis